MDRPGRVMRPAVAVVSVLVAVAPGVARADGGAIVAAVAEGVTPDLRYEVNGPPLHDGGIVLTRPVPFAFQDKALVFEHPKRIAASGEYGEWAEDTTGLRFVPEIVVEPQLRLSPPQAWRLAVVARAVVFHTSSHFLLRPEWVGVGGRDGLGGGFGLGVGIGDTSGSITIGYRAVWTEPVPRHEIGLDLQLFQVRLGPRMSRRRHAFDVRELMELVVPDVRYEFAGRAFDKGVVLLSRPLPIVLGAVPLFSSIDEESPRVQVGRSGLLLVGEIVPEPQLVVERPAIRRVAAALRTTLLHGASGLLLRPEAVGVLGEDGIGGGGGVALGIGGSLGSVTVAFRAIRTASGWRQDVGLDLQIWSIPPGSYRRALADPPTFVHAVPVADPVPE